MSVHCAKLIHIPTRPLLLKKNLALVKGDTPIRRSRVESLVFGIYFIRGKAASESTKGKKPSGIRHQPSAKTPSARVVGSGADS
jgi:hypothetical protein